MTELFNRIDSILMDDSTPSKALNELFQQSSFETAPFNLFMEMNQTEQSKQHHPEGNVWTHTLMVVDQGAKMRHESKNPRVLMWACLLHDIGKPVTTKKQKGKITSYNHDIKGAKIAQNFLGHWHTEALFIKKVSALVRWHMQPLFILKNRSGGNIRQMFQETDIEELALLSYCDRTGRLCVDWEKEEMNRKQFIAYCHTNK